MREKEDMEHYKFGCVIQDRSSGKQLLEKRDDSKSAGRLIGYNPSSLFNLILKKKWSELGLTEGCSCSESSSRAGMSLFDAERPRVAV